MAGSAAPTRGRGRPRSGTAARPELSARAQILDAAAKLFVTQGYATTSTREIAEAVGIRQASLYYHFGSKDDILDELLRATVQPSLVLLERLASVDLTPSARLWALASADATLLATRPHNPGALYLLPEVRLERFAELRAMRESLRAEYVRLVALCTSEGEEPGIRAELVFALVETVTSLRQDAPHLNVAELSETIADATLRVIGLDTDARAEAARAGRAALEGDEHYSA